MYVDDVLAIGTNPRKLLEELEEKYTLKPSSIKAPDQYLGAQIKQWRIEGSKDPTKIRWALLAEKYTCNNMKDLTSKLDKRGLKLSGKAHTPFSSQSYRPELDNTPELLDDDTNWFQGLIGILDGVCRLVASTSC